MIDMEAAHRALVESILRRHVSERNVRAFGSRVRGGAKPYSDLDLVILGPERLPQSVLFELKNDFEESDLPYRVDLLDWHRLTPAFQTAILPQSEILL